MKQEKYVIGVKYTMNDKEFQLWVQGNYDEAYARELAYNLKLVREDDRNTEKAELMASLVGYLLDDAYKSGRLFPFNPPSDHTVHIVNIDEGTVELWDETASERKVSFSFDKFIERYYK